MATPSTNSDSRLFRTRTDEKYKAVSSNRVSLVPHEVVHEIFPGKAAGVISGFE